VTVRAGDEDQPLVFQAEFTQEVGDPELRRRRDVLGHVPRGEGDRVALAVQVAPEAADPVQENAKSSSRFSWKYRRCSDVRIAKIICSTSAA